MFGGLNVAAVAVVGGNAATAVPGWSGNMSNCCPVGSIRGARSSAQPQAMVPSTASTTISGRRMGRWGEVMEPGVDGEAHEIARAKAC